MVYRQILSSALAAPAMEDAASGEEGIY